MRRFVGSSPIPSSIFFPAEVARIKGSIVRRLTLSALFASLTAVGAFIAFPLPGSPVPVTLQSFFTVMAGALLGGRYGALSQLVYILLGAFGLPVFAGGSSGFGVLVGPTGGYLFGFVLGALVAGIIAGGEVKVSKSVTWSYIRILLSLAVGTLVIYVAGVIQLSLVLRKGFMETLSIGVFPFLIGDGLKIIVAALAVRNVRRFVR